MTNLKRTAVTSIFYDAETDTARLTLRCGHQEELKNWRSIQGPIDTTQRVCEECSDRKVTKVGSPMVDLRHRAGSKIETAIRDLLLDSGVPVENLVAVIDVVDSSIEEALKSLGARLTAEALAWTHGAKSCGARLAKLTNQAIGEEK